MNNIKNTKYVFILINIILQKIKLLLFYMLIVIIKTFLKVINRGSNDKQYMRYYMRWFALRKTGRWDTWARNERGSKSHGKDRPAIQKKPN